MRYTCEIPIKAPRAYSERERGVEERRKEERRVGETENMYKKGMGEEERWGKKREEKVRGEEKA